MELAASLRKGTNRSRHKAKNDTFWSQTLAPLAADFDRIVLPIPVRTMTTTPRMMALVFNETTKVYRQDQRSCGFSNDVFILDSSSAILTMV